MTTQVVSAIADAVNIERPQAFVTDSEFIENSAAFSIWPWRLFEFLKKRTTPGSDCYLRNRKEAELVVDEMWKSWLSLIPQIRTSANGDSIARLTRDVFRDRYLSIWERNPTSLICSSSNGARSGVSVLLPVANNVYDAFVQGELPIYDINGEHVCHESQNLIYDSVYEFETTGKRKWHKIVNSVGFISFYQIALLSQDPAARGFRISTFGAIDENVSRLKSVGMIQTDADIPNFGHRIWEYSGEFEPRRPRLFEEETNRSSTSAHYIAMMKRWIDSGAGNRMKVKAAIAVIRSYQNLIKRADNRDRKAG